MKESIEKLKKDQKIDGWKRTFIQYKSRLEKRKNWKEKTKLFKEMEDKLVVDQSELAQMLSESEKNDKELADDENQDSESVHKVFNLSSEWIYCLVCKVFTF